MIHDGYSYVFLGLSITSSWGNGHATTYRALLRQLTTQGHGVTFLERELPFYRDNRDLPTPSYATTHLYQSLEELRDRFTTTIRGADLVIVGSYVPEGTAVLDWALSEASGRVAFYDIDTPSTLQQLEHARCEYLRTEQIQKVDLYLSFTGGPTLELLRARYGAKRPRPLYCSVDPELYHPTAGAKEWDLGYLGTYSDDRQAALQCLLIRVARDRPDLRLAVVGPQYPESICWPANVWRANHLAPDGHTEFYNAQRFTLNVTRQPMRAAGYSPSVRLFEAAACGTPIITDSWPGLETLFSPGKEILIASDESDVVRFLTDISEEERLAIGSRARTRVLREHTAACRADTFARYTRELLASHHRSSPVKNCGVAGLPPIGVDQRRIAKW